MDICTSTYFVDESGYIQMYPDVLVLSFRAKCPRYSTYVKIGAKIRGLDLRHHQRYETLPSDPFRLDLIC